MQTKRFFELKYGDVFTYMSKKRKVTSVENGFIYFGAYDENIYPANIKSVGWHSKEIVEYHFNKDQK